MARTAKSPRLPQNIEVLELSRQQKEICSMVLNEHLDAVMIARRLNVTPKTVRNQLGRIWAKADKVHKSVNTTQEGVNHAQKVPNSETLNLMFSTQVQRIAYLKHLGLGNRQIAEILGIKHSNVKQVVSRSKRQTLSRSFSEPVPIDPLECPRNPIEEAAIRDGARMFYNKFVSGTNKAPTREVLRGLYLTGQGGREGARIVLGDRARIMRLMAELSHCKGVRNQIVRCDETDKEIRRLCGAVLSEHFTQILPGHYRPKNGRAIMLLRSILQSSMAQDTEIGN